jgi:hypothetical protein
MSRIREKSNFIRGIVRKTIEKDAELARQSGTYNPHHL